MLATRVALCERKSFVRRICQPVLMVRPRSCAETTAWVFSASASHRSFMVVTCVWSSPRGKVLGKSRPYANRLTGLAQRTGSYLRIPLHHHLRQVREPRSTYELSLNSYYCKMTVKWRGKEYFYQWNPLGSQKISLFSVSHIFRDSSLRVISRAVYNSLNSKIKTSFIRQVRVAYSIRLSQGSLATGFTSEPPRECGAIQGSLACLYSD